VNQRPEERARGMIERMDRFGVWVHLTLRLACRRAQASLRTGRVSGSY
jgi:hypothetical protein